MFGTAARERIDSLPMSLNHAPKVTLDRQSQEWVAKCPHCDWTMGPQWASQELHDAAHEHNRENNR